MNDILTQFFDAIAGVGAGVSFFDFIISIFLAAIIILFLIEPMNENS